MEKLIKLLESLENFNFDTTHLHIGWNSHSYLWLCELSKYLRVEYGIFMIIDTHVPESPGSVYFVPQIHFPRGHKLLYSKENRVRNDNFRTDVYFNYNIGKKLNTINPKAYENALIIGLTSGLNLIEYCK